METYKPNKLLYLTCMLLVIFYACNKEGIPENETLARLHERIIGKWINDDEYTLLVTEAEITLTYPLGSPQETMGYEVVDESTIRAYRKVYAEMANAQHGVAFVDNNTLVLKNFVQGVEAIIGKYPGDVSHFHHMTFKRVGGK